MHPQADLDVKKTPTKIKTILVVDDDVLIRTFLRELLEDNGYKVHLASEGKIGRRLFMENEVDLVLTDIVMPELDGFELIRELRAKVPIIAMSGHVPVVGTYLKMAEALGAVTLNKPFLGSTLMKKVRELLGEDPVN